MPFTPAHIAAILPLVRTPLPAAALVAGSMAPDLPYFVPLGIPRDLSHSLVGIPLVDIPMGVGALVLWAFVFRAPLLAFAPGWLRLRFRVPPRAGWSWRAAVVQASLVLAALFVGILTHFVWDAFTHADGWVVVNVPAMQRVISYFTIYRWLQYLSSAIGLAIVAGWIVVWVRRTPAGVDHWSSRRVSPTWRRVAWIVVVGVTLALALAMWLPNVLAGFDPFDRRLVFLTVTLSIAVGGLLAVVLCLGWYLFPKSKPAPYAQMERSTATTLPRSSA
ncbi:DUF4184 family protein [soil metagenome]